VGGFAVRGSKEGATAERLLRPLSVGPDEEHGGTAGGDHLLSNPPEEELPESAPAVSAHEDKIWRELGLVIHDPPGDALHRLGMDMAAHRSVGGEGPARDLCQVPIGFLLLDEVTLTVNGG
jgi:hypothetical protein